MCLSLPVLLTKLIVCHMAAGLVRMWLLLKAFLLVAMTSLCLCIMYLLQWNRRWAMSSTMFGQWLQCGNSVLFMRNR